MSEKFSIFFHIKKPAASVKEDLRHLIDSYFSSENISCEYYFDDEHYFVFRCHRELLSVPYKDIIYFENRLHKIELHTSQRSFQFYKSMEALERELNHHQFLRVHQGYLVNRSHILVLRSSFLILKPGNTIIPISKSRLSMVQKALNQT